MPAPSSALVEINTGGGLCLSLRLLYVSKERSSTPSGSVFKDAFLDLLHMELGAMLCLQIQVGLYSDLEFAAPPRLNSGT